MVKIYKAVPALTLALFLAAGCGGGGGDSSSSTGGGGTTTSTPMTMTATTAPEAAAAASVAVNMSTGMSSFSMPMPKAVADTGAGTTLATVMGDVRNYVNTALASGSGRTSYSYEIVNQSETGCTGSTSVSASVDTMPNPTSITGTFTFTNYSDFNSYPPVPGDCSSEKMNGSVTFSGVKSGTNNISSITFTNFSSIDSSVTAQINGTMSVTEAQSGLTSALTANLTVAKIVGGITTDTLKLTNFHTTSTYTSDFATQTMSEDGTIEYNDKAFTITTVTPMVINDANYDDHPSSGQIVLDATGKARVTFLTDTTVRVEVDPTESGTYQTPPAFEGTWVNLLTITGFN